MPHLGGNIELSLEETLALLADTLLLPMVSVGAHPWAELAWPGLPDPALKQSQEDGGLGVRDTDFIFHCLHLWQLTH